ncbi:MAG: lipoprotein [Variovorax sp.]
MLNVRQILVSAIGLAIFGVCLTACGQKGSLYLPTDPAAKGRATLQDLLVPGASNVEAAQPPATAASGTPATGESAR